MKYNEKKIVKIISLFLFFALITFYSIFVSRNIILGVKIKNVNIIDGIKITESIIKITGNAKNATDLAINGREISLNQKGDFEETLALLPSYNIVHITAKDKFGYIDEKNYRLIYR